VRRDRLERLLSVQRRSSAEYRTARLGATAEVLWEEEADGLQQGLTADYVRVYAAGDSRLANRIVPTLLERPHGEGVYGVPDLP
jgi:hypothetical protein